MIKELKDSGKKLSDKTYEILEAEIVSRNFKPGTALREEEIAQQLNISATPLREAFNKLEKEGLISRKPHHSAIVKPLKERDVYELYQVREALECLAIRLAVKNISKNTIRDLEKIISKSEKSVAKSRLHEYVKTNREFHSCIFRVAGNSRLEVIMNSIHNQLTILMITTAKIPGKSGSSIMQHKEMIKALQSKDEDFAEKLMRKHIRDSLNDILTNVLIHEDGL